MPMPATILVADDELFIVEFVATVLEDEGYRVERAYNGREALTRLAHGGCDLLITDNMMPHLSGLQLIAHLRAEPRLDLPVILMSAATPQLPSPPTVFLPKPFDLDDLLARVAALLGRG